MRPLRELHTVIPDTVVTEVLTVMGREDVNELLSYHMAGSKRSSREAMWCAGCKTRTERNMYRSHSGADRHAQKGNDDESGDCV